MAHPLYRDHFTARIRHAVEQARAASGIAHHGLAGGVRELLVGEILRPALPPHIGIETGVAMVDHDGGQSPEVDVVVYDTSVLAPLYYLDRPKVVPLDACIYAIEVKTRLTATAVSDALDKADRIAGMSYVSELMAHGRPHSRVVTALFAFDSDLTGPGADEVQRVTDRRGGVRHPEIARIEGEWFTIDAPALKVLCVVGRCYAWHDVARTADERVVRDSAGRPADYMWQLWSPNDDDFDEVLAFVGGLANTVVANMGRRLWLGEYLIAP